MKETSGKSGAKTKVLTTIISSAVTLIVGLVGGGELTKVRINQESKQQIKSSNAVNITNNMESANSIIQDLLNQLEEKESEIKKLEEDNKKLEEDSKKSEKSTASKESSGQNTVNNTSETDTDTKAVTDTEILKLFQDGEYQTKYTLDEDNGSFKIAGKDYYSGVTIGNTDSGFVLVRLGKQYTHMSFDIGRVDETTITNGKLLIIKDGTQSKEYTLDGEKSLMSVDFDVTDTDTLKIQIDPDWSTYGIVNIKLD